MFRSRVTGNLMTALSVPIRSKDQGAEPIGVLCMAVEAGAFADFLGSLAGGPKFEPTMRTALATQRVCDAVLESAKPSR